jgi:hypothetical protein
VVGAIQQVRTARDRALLASEQQIENIRASAESQMQPLYMAAIDGFFGGVGLATQVRGMANQASFLQNAESQQEKNERWQLGLAEIDRTLAELRNAGLAQTRSFAQAQLNDIMQRNLWYEGRHQGLQSFFENATGFTQT